MFRVEPLLLQRLICAARSAAGVGGAMIVKGEALVRLEAERRLLNAYANEYERLLKRTDHVRAVRALVKSHKVAYGAALAEARTWAIPVKPAGASTQAA
jgi:hypothetical protein